MSLLLLFNGGGAAQDIPPPTPVVLAAHAFLSHGDGAIGLGALGVVGESGTLAAVEGGASTAVENQAPAVTITGGGTTTIQ
jgi:hypothetical protein